MVFGTFRLFSTSIDVICAYLPNGNRFYVIRFTANRFFLGQLSEYLCCIRIVFFRIVFSFDYLPDFIRIMFLKNKLSTNWAINVFFFFQNEFQLAINSISLKINEKKEVS